MGRVSKQTLHMRLVAKQQRDKRLAAACEIEKEPEKSSFERECEPEIAKRQVTEVVVTDIPPVVLPCTNKSPPKLCVFSTLVSGGTFNQMETFCANMNIQYVAKTTFYRIQKQIGSIIKELAEESMRKCRESLTRDSIVCADGRYPIRRNSSHCTVDIIDNKTGKVLALGTVDKTSTFHPNETFNDTSNMMETEALRRALSQFETFENLTSIVIDGDNKNKKVIEDTGKDIKILRDPNHAKLSFEKYLSKETNKWKTMDPSGQDCFAGVREKIKRWYTDLLYMDIPLEQKKMQWMNVVEHLLGNHSNCLQHDPTSYIWKEGLDNPEVALKLKEILENRISDFENIVAGCATQKSESFHRIQLIFGDKSLRFPVSQEIRDYLAILHQNEGETYIRELRDRLKIRSFQIKQNAIIQRRIDERLRNSEIRRTFEYRKHEAKYRSEKSKSNKKSKLGDYKKENPMLGAIFN